MHEQPEKDYLRDLMETLKYPIMAEQETNTFISEEVTRDSLLEDAKTDADRPESATEYLLERLRERILEAHGTRLSSLHDVLNYASKEYPEIE
jgi:hypothetical protein